MKKALSLILALALTVSMFCTLAMAAEVPGNSSHDVTLELDTKVVHKYSVDVEFPDLTFTYTAEQEWSSSDYTYSDSGSWSDPQTVKVINHSDLDLYFTASAAKETKYAALTVSVNGADHVKIDKCNVGDSLGQHFAEFTVGVEGTPPADAADNEKIATLLIQFSAN